MTLNFIGKPGTGVHLLKERAKLHREHSERKVYALGKRLSGQVVNHEEEKQNGPKPEKRKNMGSNNSEAGRPQTKD